VKYRLLIFITSSLLLIACDPKRPTTYQKVDEIVDLPTKNSGLTTGIYENLGGNFMWSEGPVWIKDGGYLLFTDVPGNTIYKFKEDEGITTWMAPSGHPDPKPSYTSSAGANGLYPFDGDHIIVPDHGNRTLYT